MIRPLLLLLLLTPLAAFAQSDLVKKISPVLAEINTKVSSGQLAPNDATLAQFQKLLGTADPTQRADLLSQLSLDDTTLPVYLEQLNPLKDGSELTKTFSKLPKQIKKLAPYQQRRLIERVSRQFVHSLKSTDDHPPKILIETINKIDQSGDFAPVLTALALQGPFLSDGTSSQIVNYLRDHDATTYNKVIQAINATQPDALAKILPAPPKSTPPAPPAPPKKPPFPPAP